MVIAARLAGAALIFLALSAALGAAATPPAQPATPAAPATQPANPGAAFTTPIGTSGLTGAQVLAEFAKTQDAQMRIIFKYRWTASCTSNARPWAASGTDGGTGEIRSDGGSRLYVENRRWGDPGAPPSEPKDPTRKVLVLHGLYMMWGPASLNEKAMAQTLAPNHDAKLVLGVDYEYPVPLTNWANPEIAFWSNDGPEEAEGYLSATTGRVQQRFDAFLHQCAQVSFAQERSADGKTRFIVAQGTDNAVSCKFWFDPSHGYMPAKTERTWTRPADFRGNYPRQSERYAWSVTKFQSFKGIWVPVEVDSKYEGAFTTPGLYARSNGHMTLRDVVVNPDFDALGSFSIDLLPAKTSFVIGGSEFRIVSKRTDLSSADLDRYQSDCQAGRVGYWWNQKAGNSTPDYLWMRMTSGVRPAADMITGEYHGQKYLLLSNQTGQCMTPVYPPGPWPPRKSGGPYERAAEAAGRVTSPPGTRYPWNTQYYPVWDEKHQPSLRYELDQPGAEKLAAFTKEHVDQTLAIIAGWDVLGLAKIDAPMSGKGLIPGFFNGPEEKKPVTTQPVKKRG